MYLNALRFFPFSVHLLSINLSIIMMYQPGWSQLCCRNDPHTIFPYFLLWNYRIISCCVSVLGQPASLPHVSPFGPQAKGFLPFESIRTGRRGAQPALAVKSFLPDVGDVTPSDFSANKVTSPCLASEEQGSTSCCESRGGEPENFGQ